MKVLYLFTHNDKCIGHINRTYKLHHLSNRFTVMRVKIIDKSQFLINLFHIINKKRIR
jgi:hypothetical protein